ncbi:Acetoin utilization deacetylase AcuC [Tistlia consotensis]|uniref:Acetoin utilization deacetylase AcuC n=1 Tax=Tistlia consotensis USBA 355 TaxID=560819 RepID=A0A1Y6CEX5_9PROT|nr:histone deacetylase family protein [Tistlia consotensis]SMF60710.1 Acetoin utilization deacetylase AcuC [Tistlia consotensis USBA 355]SNR92951.1 Acetoin utilization deacetylase AcuC [Tistlia consotensis]
MSTLLFTHPACGLHDPGHFHPESPARLKAVLDALSAPEFAALQWREAPQATRAQLERLHPADYVDAVLAAIPAEGHAALDGDTSVSPGSGEAALRAAGAVCAAVDAVMAGEADNAFCAVRPPGHHAEPERAMGFCLFSNIALGAFHGREAHRLQRIAVVDFDVHHGNGTQAAFWDDQDLLFASTHQMPLYPGTGSAAERGAHNNVLNVPLAPGSGSTVFRRAMGERILPRLAAFEPQLILISAGFDAHKGDPLAGLAFEDDDFAWITGEVCRIADHACRGRVVSALEGGYDLDALASSAAAHVRALMAAA